MLFNPWACHFDCSGVVAQTEESLCSSFSHKLNSSAVFLSILMSAWPEVYSSWHWVDVHPGQPSIMLHCNQCLCFYETLVCVNTPTTLFLVMYLFILLFLLIYIILFIYLFLPKSYLMCNFTFSICNIARALRLRISLLVMMRHCYLYMTNKNILKQQPLASSWANKIRITNNKLRLKKERRKRAFISKQSPWQGRTWAHFFHSLRQLKPLLKMRCGLEKSKSTDWNRQVKSWSKLANELRRANQKWSSTITSRNKRQARTT